MFKSINRVVKILILSDVILLTGLGFISPVFAIFIANNIQGGDVRVAGFAASIYWIVLSLVLIPIGKYLDKKPGEKYDLGFIVIGNILAALAAFGYLFSFLPWHIYVLQAVYGIGMGMSIPGYMAIFTRHIDKGKEAQSWGTRSAFVGVGAGIAGSLGGIIVYRFGFDLLFIIVGTFLFFSALLPLLISKELLLKKEKLFSIQEIKTIEPPISRGQRK